jgi:hypothetical protein
VRRAVFGKGQGIHLAKGESLQAGSQHPLWLYFSRYYHGGGAGPNMVSTEIAAKQVVVRLPYFWLSLEGSEAPGRPEELGHSSDEA